MLKCACRRRPHRHSLIEDNLVLYGQLELSGLLWIIVLTFTLQWKEMFNLRASLSNEAFYNHLCVCPLYLLKTTLLC